MRLTGALSESSLLFVISLLKTTNGIVTMLKKHSEMRKIHVRIGRFVVTWSWALLVSQAIGLIKPVFRRISKYRQKPFQAKFE